MCLSRPFLWILMIASTEYWDAFKGLQRKQAEACYIPQTGEEAIGECEPFVYSVESSLHLTCNSSSTNISAENVTNLEWFKDGHHLDTRGWIFSKENLSFDDSGNYTCQISSHVVSSHKVLVGDKPQKIPQPTCISRILGNYTCSWDEGSNFNLTTRYQIHFDYPHGDEIITCRDTTGANSCQINGHTPMAGYHVFLCAENCLGDAESSRRKIDPYSPELKLFPPSNVLMLPISLISMNITFDLPEGWVGPLIGFYINYTQSCTGYDDQAKEKKMGKQRYQDSRVWTEIDLTAKPYSKVCVTIGSYFTDKNKPTEYSDLLCAHTPMAKPSTAPEHFTYHYVNDTDDRSVNFTWQELDPCMSNGIIRSYILNLISKTHNDSFKIFGNRTSFVVKGLSWHEEYHAELYAVNDIAVSEAAVTIVPSAPNKIAWPVVLMIVFFSTLFVCFILTCCRCYFKVKKRVLPNIPEPTYYNKSFMTQIQYSHLSEPEVFDELRTCDVVERVQTSNSGESPLIDTTTTSHDSDTPYAYSRFGSSLDSSPHVGSRDFAGLQAARPVDVQHNTYTSYPGSTSTPPAMEERTSGSSNRKGQEVTGEEEDPDADPDEYARFALLSDDEVFIDERETTSHQNESKEDEECREDEVKESLITDSRGLSYSSVTEVSAENIEESPNINDTNPTHRAYPPKILKEMENKSSQSNPPLSCQNIQNDGKPSSNTSPYQPHKDVTVSSDPSHCRSLLTPGRDKNQPNPGNGSLIPYNDIVNQQQNIDRDGGQPTGDLNHPLVKVTNSRGMEPEEDLNSFSYLPESAGSKFSDPSEQGESYNTHHSSNDGSDLRNREEDPYITHETLVAGSRSGDQTVKIEPIAAQSDTGLQPQADPYISHPPTASKPTSQDDPYISHDSGASGPKTKNCQVLQHDPYVSRESAAATALQLNPSLQDPYVTQESGASGPNTKSCHAMKPDPYVSHESAAAGPMPLNPTSGDDPYIPHESGASGSNTNTCQALQPDRYISNESTTARSAQLNPSLKDPYISQESGTCAPNTNSCHAMKPDPYVSHESAAAGPMPLNPTSEDDPYIPHESGASGSNTNTCQALQPDPYISNESTTARSAQLNPSLKDPYISQESGTCAPNTNSCHAMKPDPYVSHESVAAGQMPLNPTSEDDPYIPHESGASGSNTNTCQALQPDPYTSHESAAIQAV